MDVGKADLPSRSDEKGSFARANGTSLLGSRHVRPLAEQAPHQEGLRPTQVVPPARVTLCLGCASTTGP